MRRLLLGLGLVGGSVLALSGCASSGYGSAGGFESYDDCYDGYCVGYDAYGRAYRRPLAPDKRGPVDRIDRAPGETRTVDRSAPRATSSSSTAAASRMSVSRSAPPPPPPASVSRHP
jgi:hypothetical protein